MLAPRYAHAMFCDDIRHETQGKFSLIGMIHSGTLLVQGGFPVTAPRLCVWWVVNTPIDKRFETLALMLKGSPLGEAPVIQDIPTADKEAPSSDGALRFSVQVFMQMDLFQLHGPGIIDAVAVVDDEEYLAGRLRIKAAETAAES